MKIDRDDSGRWAVHDEDCRRLQREQGWVEDRLQDAIERAQALGWRAHRTEK